MTRAALYARVSTNLDEKDLKNKDGEAVKRQDPEVQLIKLRRNLRELDTFWERELARRGGTGNPMPPADCYWYIYTRQAYLEILGQQAIDDEVSVRDAIPLGRLEL